MKARKVVSRMISNERLQELIKYIDEYIVADNGQIMKQVKGE